MLTSHFLRPLLLFVIVAGLFEFTHIDLWLADQLFHWSGDSWSWRDAWVTETLIHRGGRILAGLVLIINITLLAMSYRLSSLQPLRHGLWYLLISVLLSLLLVNIMKHLTHVNCPWDLLRYGGDFDYVRTFVNYAHAGDVGQCFPAGHASAAYSWWGLYYLAREYRPRWRFRVLVGVLGMGLLYGGGQQLRGAHFLSHDLWTAGLCWFVATATSLWWFAPQGSSELAQ